MIYLLLYLITIILEEYKMDTNSRPIKQEAVITFDESDRPIIDKAENMSPHAHIFLDAYEKDIRTNKE